MGGRVVHVLNPSDDGRSPACAAPNSYESGNDGPAGEDVVITRRMMTLQDDRFLTDGPRLTQEVATSTDVNIRWAGVGKA